MKAPSEHSFKSSAQYPTKQRDESEAGGNLFLGHKLLGELRILMRLASPVGGVERKDSKAHKGRSY